MNCCMKLINYTIVRHELEIQNHLDHQSSSTTSCQKLDTNNLQKANIRNNSDSLHYKRDAIYKKGFRISSQLNELITSPSSSHELLLTSQPMFKDVNRQILRYMKLILDTFNITYTYIKQQSRSKMNLMNSSTRLVVIFLSLLFILQTFPLACTAESLGNPYHILGVTRHASPKDIRKAYKNLAKEWHPDKSDHPSAEAKFVEINKAYEILSDPERRRKFDNHGITEEGIPRYKRESTPFDMNDPFEEFFSGNYQFHYQNRDISLFHKMSITFRAYENNVLPKSYKSPYLIFVYSDWCFSCLQVEPIWRRLRDELEPLGVNLVTVHAQREAALARKLSIHSLPCLAVTIDGRTSLYRETLFSVQKIVDFLKSRFPYKLLYKINNDNVDDFLAGWADNKIRALIFESKEAPRLRYLLIALHHRDRVVFGFVQTGIPETDTITDKYKISDDTDTLLLFNENLDKPVASVSMQDIPSDTMHNIIASNKFLILPRLSNQAMLESVCPQVWQKTQKRLCAILVSQNNPDYDVVRSRFRQAALESPHNSDRIRYAYLFKETQPTFISALLTSESSPIDPLNHVVIIWRRDSNHIKYEWFDSGWAQATTNEDKWNETRLSLEQTIQRLLRSSEALPYTAEVQELSDEHAMSLIDKVINKVMIAVEFMSENLTKEQVLPILSVLATLLLIIAVGYGMSYLVKIEEASIQAKYGQFQGSTKSISTQPQLKLHEMRAETYNGLVRLLKPGCRTIVLLVDNQSKIKLLPAFHKAVWPYRKNKTLMFCHLSLERGLEWYKKILTLSLPEPRELNINSKNCVGTVLSLNGHRKYFCMYHAKHPECQKGKGNKRMLKITKHLVHPNDAEAGAFIGFDSSSDSDNSQNELGHEDILFQENLLDGLPMWLDRLFEGSTHRYYINYWPDFTAK